MRKKTALPLLVSLLLMIGTGQLHAAAKYVEYTDDDGNTYNIYYSVSSGTNATVTNIYDRSPSLKSYVDTITAAYGSSSITAIAIPETLTVDGTAYTVTAIDGSCFANCTNLKSITLPSTVTSIGTFAFYGCTSLTTVSLSGCTSLTSLGEKAFYGCTSLATITGLDSTQITSIGDSMFYNCSLLTSVSLPSTVTSIGSRAFHNCTLLASVTGLDSTKITSLGDYAFRSCTSLGSITLPSTVTSIGTYAFYDCTALTSIVLTGCTSLTSIGKCAFYGCTSLATITGLEDTQITSIGDSMFMNCSALVSVSLPSTVTSIGASAFYYCKSLTSADMSKATGVTSIGGSAFYNCSLLTSVGDLSGLTELTSLGTMAFYNCSSLKEVCLSGATGLTSISNRAFYNCSALTSVGDLSKLTALTSIDYSAFYNCSLLTSVGDLSGLTALTSIGYKAFCYCSSLKNISIPANVTSIGYTCFDSCTSLDSVTFAENSCLTSLGGYATFANCTSLKKVINFPKGVTELVDGTHTGTTSASSGVVAIERWGVFAGCTNLDSIELSGVKTVGQYSFYNCTALKKVTFNGDSLTSIGNKAFYNCTSLASADLSDATALTTINSYAFYNCNSLASADLSNATALTTIGSYAFWTCSTLTKMVIPENVTSIGSYAFRYCTGLTEVKIYAPSLTTYGSGVFSRSSSSTESTFINGLTVYVLPYSLDDYKAGWSYSSYVIYPFSDRTVKSSTTAVTAAYPFDAYLPDGFEAYTLSFTGGSTASATSVSKDTTVNSVSMKYLPADTPAYITYKASADTTVCFYGVNGDEVTDSCVEDNSSRTYGALVGVYASEGEYASVGDYVLQNQGSGPQFYYVNSENSALVGQFKAYLRTESTTSEAPAVLDITFDESETTGISHIDGTTTTGTTADAVYNLQGVRMNNVDSLPKGVYIRGGKKFVVK